jgi:hypothetical protein
MRVSETSQSKPRASQPVIELTEAEPIAEKKKWRGRGRFIPFCVIYLNHLQLNQLVNQKLAKFNYQIVFRCLYFSYVLELWQSHERIA